MEFHEKLQHLRRQRGLTQEELAAHLYVSRAAVSKWESGRGYPNIDSLKAIAVFYGVTIDELLSGEEALTIAQDELHEKQARFRDLLFGLFDCGIVLLLFMPFFGQKTDGIIREVSLLSLTGISPHLRLAYFILIFATLGTGILTLALRDSPTARERLWTVLSLALNTAGVLLFTISLQPYAAIYLFLFLVIKGLMLIQKH